MPRRGRLGDVAGASRPGNAEARTPRVRSRGVSPRGAGIRGRDVSSRQKKSRPPLKRQGQAGQRIGCGSRRPYPRRSPRMQSRIVGLTIAQKFPPTTVGKIGTIQARTPPGESTSVGHFCGGFFIFDNVSKSGMDALKGRWLIWQKKLTCVFGLLCGERSSEQRINRSTDHVSPAQSVPGLAILSAQIRERFGIIRA